MEIQGPGKVQGPGRVQGVRASSPVDVARASAARTGDSVEFSTVARLRASLASVPEVRREKVDRIREEIANGTYETPEKLNLAVDRLLEELGLG